MEREHRTRVVKIDREALAAGEPKTRQNLMEAAKFLKDGELVAFPTETVYGLGADGLNADAAGKIYAAKERPSDNPLILHIADLEHLYPLVKNVPEEALLLAKKFWPGPLTMIFFKSDIVPLSATGGLDTVAVRMPDDAIARSLIRESDTAIAAPSANTSGRPSPTRAEYVFEDMNGKIPLILDGGAVGIGLESTILDLTVRPPRILRPGAITAKMLREALGGVLLEKHGESSQAEAPKAPGMKYRHYAPKAKLIVVEGSDAAKKIIKLAGHEKSLGKGVGIIATKENLETYRRVWENASLCGSETDAPLDKGDSAVAASCRNDFGIEIRVIGEQANEAGIARNLFAILREFDKSDVQIIFSESFEGDGMRMAIMNRLLKAAGHNVIR